MDLLWLEKQLREYDENLKLESDPSTLYIGEDIRVRWSYSGGRFGGCYIICKGEKYIDTKSYIRDVLNIVKGLL